MSGVFGNDQGHTYDVSLSMPLSSNGLAQVISNIISFAQNLFYNLGSINCTDLAVLIFNSQGAIDIPNCESPVPIWTGQTPGTLGEIIRGLTLSASTEATKNTTAGAATS